MSIYNKLSIIQNGLKASKSKRNNFGNYNYRSCEDILEAVKPLLFSHKLSLLIYDETSLIGDVIVINSTAELTDGDRSIKTTAQAAVDLKKKGMDSAQCFGSSSSYARKYALNGMFCIDDTKDPDETNDHGRREVKARSKAPDIGGFSQVGRIIEAQGIGKSSIDSDSQKVLMASDSQKRAIFAIVKSLGINEEVARDSMKNVCGKDATKDLTISEASEVISYFKSLQEV